MDTAWLYKDDVELFDLNLIVLLKKESKGVGWK